MTFRLTIPHHYVRSVAGILTFLAAHYLDNVGAVAAQAALIGWALRGSRESIQALSLSWLASVLSPNVFPHDSLYVAYLGKWLVLVAAASRTYWVAIRQRQPLPRVCVYLTLFAVVSTVSSIVVSLAPSVSLFKLTAFLLGATTVLLAFKQIPLDRNDLSYWFLSLGLVVVVLSALLINSPAGYKHIYKSAPLFQGLLTQPQELAVFLAPLVAWLLARLMNGTSTPMTNAILGGMLILLAASGSRTGFAAGLGGCLIPLGIALFLKPGWRQELASGFKHPSLVIGLAIMALCATLNAEQIAQGVSRIIYKRAGSVVGEFQASRGFLIREQLANIRRSPVLGIGFGMPSDHNQFRPSTEMFLGIPLGAPIEKGILYVGILEENGIIGAFAFVFVLMSVVISTARRGFPFACMAIAVLLNNLGEANLFAIGGMGLFYWLMLGYALYGPQRSQQLTQPPMDALPRTPSVADLRG